MFQFPAVDIQELIIYLFIIGVVLEFIRMLPQAVKHLFLTARRRLKKVKLEELAEELGACKNESECESKIQTVFEGAMDALGDRIESEVKEARAEFRKSISRVHERIDKHLDKAPAP